MLFHTDADAADDVRVSDSEDADEIEDRNRRRVVENARAGSVNGDEDGRGVITTMILEEYRRRTALNADDADDNHSNGGWERGTGSGRERNSGKDRRWRRAAVHRFIDDGGSIDGDDADEALHEDDKAFIEDEEYSDVSLERTRGRRPMTTSMMGDDALFLDDALDDDEVVERLRRVAENRERRESERLEDGFEVSDGELSSHSEGSQDRTRGVKSFKVSDVVNEQFGRGKRGLVRHTVRGRSVADVLREAPTASTSASDASDEEEESPVIVREKSPERRDVVVERAVSPQHRRKRTFGEMNKSFTRVVDRQPQITAVFTKAAAPWKFNYRVFERDDEVNELRDISNHLELSINDDDAMDEIDFERCAAFEDATRRGEGILRMAMTDFVNKNSVGRVGVGATRTAKTLSDSDASNWRHAMALLERGRGFWNAVRELLPTFYDAERNQLKDSPENAHIDDASHARCLEVAWELLFTSAKLWYSEGYQNEHAVRTKWSIDAWAVVGWLLDESRLARYPSCRQNTARATRPSPSHFNANEYTRVVCERVCELVACWPRCVADQHPTRVLWKRLHGADLHEAEESKDNHLGVIDDRSSCCQACMPLIWRPYDASFKAARAGFVHGATCELLYRALGLHLCKCAAEHKVLRRELGKWFNDARLGKVIDDPDRGVGSPCFRALGGHALALSNAAMKLQHRASVHAELFRACASSGLHDQAVICLKQILNAIFSQQPASEDPAPRSILLRAATTCWGMSLAEGDSSRHPGDEPLRWMKALFDVAKTTGSAEPPAPGSAEALNHGAVIAEMSATWASAFTVLASSAPERVQEAFDVFGDLHACASSSDWRVRVFTSRTLATLCSPGSFADKFGIKDVRPLVSSWLAFAVDSVVGGAAPLGAALCAREELLRMNQEATAVSTVGWSQSKGGAAMAAVLRGRTPHKPTTGTEAHICTIGDFPGALVSARESGFRVAVAKLVVKELSSASFDGDAATRSAIDRLVRDLPAHTNRLHRQIRSAEKGGKTGSVQAPYVNVVSGVVRELLTLGSADCIDAAKLSFVVPFPPAAAAFWGVTGAGERSRLGDMISKILERDARDIFTSILIRASSSATSATFGQAERLKEFVFTTCGVLESITGSVETCERENHVLKSLASALRLPSAGGAVEAFLKRYLPHFMLSSLSAPQKCAARRLLTSIKLISELVSQGLGDDEDGLAPPSVVLNATALSLVVVADEITSVDVSGDHHSAAAICSVLTDVLCPLFGGKPQVTTASATTTAVSSASLDNSGGARSRQMPQMPAPAQSRPLVFPKPAPARARPAFPFPGATSTSSASVPPPSRAEAPRAPTNVVAAAVVPAANPNKPSRALGSSAVGRIVRAYVSSSISLLINVALAAPVNLEKGVTSFQVVVGRDAERAPRAREIERLRNLLLEAKASTRRRISKERKDAEISLGDALAPLPEFIRNNGDDYDDSGAYEKLGDVRWNEASRVSLAPNAYTVEENVAERSRRIIESSARFLSRVAKSGSDNGFAPEVCRRASEIQAAVALLLEPGYAASKSLAAPLKTLVQSLGVPIITIPPKASQASGETVTSSSSSLRGRSAIANAHRGRRR